MHDIDRAMFEAEQEQEYEEPGSFGETFEFESYDSEAESEAFEMEMAAQLLEVTSDEELEQFLGNLVKAASSAARGFINSPTGRALGGVLKNAAKKALPQVGRIIGDAVVPGLGGQFGQSAGKWLGNRFELEGLSAEDQEFEVARALVRVTKDATRNAIAAGPSAPPRQTATKAAVKAAQRQMPGLVPVLTGAQTGSSVSPRTGRWVRRGRRIVLLDV